MSEATSIKRLVDLVSRVGRERPETSIPELVSVFEIPSDLPILEKALQVKSRLKGLGLRLIPDFDVGEVEVVRCLDFADEREVTSGLALREIRSREDSALEFKASVLYDYQKAEHQPQSSMAELKSSGVLHSCLKTIAAFLNSRGGVLYIGVDDSGSAIGLDLDFKCVSEKKPGPDSWELKLRDSIKSQFRDGDAANQYVEVVIVNIEGKDVARLKVSPRSKLSFLRRADSETPGACVPKNAVPWCLYRRDGNRTIEVGIDQVEEYLEFRKGQEASC